MTLPLTDLQMVGQVKCLNKGGRERRKRKEGERRKREEEERELEWKRACLLCLSCSPGCNRCQEITKKPTWNRDSDVVHMA